MTQTRRHKQFPHRRPQRQHHRQGMCGKRCLTNIWVEHTTSTKQQKKQDGTRWNKLVHKTVCHTELTQIEAGCLQYFMICEPLLYLAFAGKNGKFFIQPKCPTNNIDRIYFSLSCYFFFLHDLCSTLPQILCFRNRGINFSSNQKDNLKRCPALRGRNG